MSLHDGIVFLATYLLPSTLVAAVVYYIVYSLRELKGSARLRITRSRLDLSRFIVGKAVVRAKNDISIQGVELTLIAEVRRRNRADSTKDHLLEVYRSKQRRRVSAELDAGAKKSFPIRISLPSASLDRKSERKLRKALSKDRVEFTVHAKFLCSGLDLLAKRRVDVRRPATMRERDSRTAIDKLLGALKRRS